MPRLVNSKPRFRCDFCRYQATEPTVIRHERFCWNNPDRFCDLCQNEGWIDDRECYYCAKRIIWDEEQKKKLELAEAVKGLKLIQRSTT